MEIGGIDKLVSHNEVSLVNFVDLDRVEEFPPTSATRAQSSTVGIYNFIVGRRNWMYGIG